MADTLNAPTDYIEATLSDSKKVAFRHLNGLDIRHVNRITGQNIGNIVENQALFALVSINDDKLTPPVSNEMHLDSRAARFDGQEYLKLIEAYGKAFYEDIRDPK